MKKFFLLVWKKLISSNKKIYYNFPEKLTIFTNCFLSDVFDSDFEYTNHFFTC